VDVYFSSSSYFRSNSRLVQLEDELDDEDTYLENDDIDISEIGLGPGIQQLMTLMGLSLTVPVSVLQLHCNASQNLCTFKLPVQRL
jgi:hypothetical protein